MSGAGRGADVLWAAVGDPTRRQLLDLLLASGTATATALAGELPVTRQAVAKHLQVLTRAGLVNGWREGREVHYTVRPDRLDEVSRAMATVSADWDRRLAAIKRLAETARAQTEADG
jgi:predicted ArsR family transcriptional regulator